MKRLIGYLRVSSEISKNKGNSIGNQFNKVKGFCELNDYELVDIIKDEERTKVEEKDEDGPEGWTIATSILAAEASETIENFEFSTEEMTFEQGEKVAEKVAMEKGKKLYNKLVLEDYTINKTLIPEAAKSLQPEFDAKILIFATLLCK